AALLGGYAAITLGLVLVGPLLTAWAGALAARRAGSAASLIAANRIARHPASLFRSVSGLVVAVFMVTLFSAASSGVVSGMALVEAPDRLQPDALLTRLAPGADITAITAGTDGVIG